MWTDMALTRERALGLKVAIAVVDFRPKPPTK
jgi:hypothetical protein